MKGNQQVAATPSQSEDDENTSHILNYLSKQLGPVDNLAAREILPMLGSASVTVHFVQPTKQHNDLTLSSTGPSSVALTVPEGREGFQHAEYVLHLPPSWPHPKNSDPKWQWPVSLFKQVAYMAHLKNAWIGLNRIAAIDIDSGWPDVSGLTHILLLADLIPAATRPDGQKIHFYTLIP